MNNNDVSSITATKQKSPLNSINSTENYINKKYDEIALHQLKQFILPELHTIVNNSIPYTK